MINGARVLGGLAAVFVLCGIGLSALAQTASTGGRPAKPYPMLAPISRDSLDGLPIFEAIELALPTPEDALRVTMAEYQLPYLAGEWYGLPQLTSLRSLDVRQNQLLRLPHGLVGLLNLQVLVLDENPLPELPDSLFMLPNLEELSLGRMNKLQWMAMGEPLARLPRLQRLNLSRNNLERIPPGLPGVKGLTHLNLSGNKLGRSDGTLGRLTSLVELSLANNGLLTVPAGLGSLKQLRRLDLSGNSLTSIPIEVLQLPNLETLTLSGNRISPEERKAIEALRPELWVVW